jgi:hypothetical protein
LEDESLTRLLSHLPFVLLGTLFGIILTKAEIVSWFRIQEMFRFQSFHMYGVLFSAILVAALSLALLKRLKVLTLGGEPVSVPPKTMGKGQRYILGGSLFGVGWGLSGACPGPMFALVGAGASVMIVAVVSAILGTWVYAAVRHKLPH